MSMSDTVATGMSFTSEITSWSHPEIAEEYGRLKLALKQKYEYRPKRLYLMLRQILLNELPGWHVRKNRKMIKIIPILSNI